ncbi:MAG: nitroreductase family protein, partial [Brevinematales bacterium]
MIRDASVMFFLTAYSLRTLRKYRERGFRFLYIDAGHMAEHIYLLATAYGFGACALGGAYDWEVEKWLGIDGLQETLIYGVVAG